MRNPSREDLCERYPGYNFGYHFTGINAAQDVLKLPVLCYCIHSSEGMNYAAAGLPWEVSRVYDRLSNHQPHDGTFFQTFDFLVRMLTHVPAMVWPSLSSTDFATVVRALRAESTP